MANIVKIDIDGNTLIDLSDNTKNTVTSSEQLVRGTKAIAQDGSSITGTYDGIIPSGTKNITDNGTYDVYDKAGVDVNIPFEERTVDPSTSDQIITPNSGYKAMTKVTVNKVTSAIDSNIKASNIITGKSILGVNGTAVVPSGSIRYSKNGDYDITNYEWVEVRVPPIMSDTLITLLTYTNYTAIFDLKNWGSGYELCLTTSNSPVALYPTYGDNTVIGNYGNAGGWRNHTLNNREPVESVNICIKANNGGTISSVIVTLFKSNKNGIEFLFTGSQLNGAVLSPGNQNRISVKSDLGIEINGKILNIPTTIATFDYGLKDNGNFTNIFYEFKDVNTNNLYLHSDSAVANQTGAVYSLQTEQAGTYPGLGAFATGTLTGWQDCAGTITGTESKSINGTACLLWTGTTSPNTATTSAQYLTGHLSSIHSNVSQGYIYFQLGVARDSSSKNPYCLYNLEIYE